MAKSKTGRSNPALRFALLRQLHVYISVFVAPTLIFFALTGALQTFRIPDQKSAPVVLQKLARLHKDDVFAVKAPRPPRPASAKPDAKPVEKATPARSTQIIKWFFAIVSVGVAISAALGLWMALAYHKRKLLMWLLVLAGAAAPVAILMM